MDLASLIISALAFAVSGEEIVLLKLVVQPDDVSKTTNLDKKVKFDMRLTYESVHGKSDVWASDDRLLNK